MIATGIALALIFLVGWTLVGYPCVVLLLARLWPAPTVRRAAATPLLDVAIPVKNGSRWLDAKLASVVAQRYPADRIRIILVSDGSTDQTVEIASQWQARDARVELREIPPSGKSVALNAAMEMSTAEIVVLTDVRQPLDPDCLRFLVEAFADPTVGAVSGELRIREDGTAPSVSLYWRLETMLRHALGRLDSMLGATGPIYAIRRSEVRRVPPGTILDDMFLPLGAFFNGKRLVSEPRAVAWDESMDLGTEFSRKVRTLAGNYQLLVREPRLLSPFKNRMFWHYLSYKVARLMLPHFLLLLVVVSLFLPAPLRSVLLVSQAIFLLIALCDRFVPSTLVVSKISRPVATFATMVWAAFLAQKIFFVPGDSLWIPTKSTR